MTSSLENKVALVTGGTSGIGRATAIAFASAGAKLIIAGRRQKEGEEVVSTIKSSGGEAYFIQTDVTDENSIKALIDKTNEMYGRLDCAFNNAGIDETPGLTADKTSADYDLIMDTNFRSVFLSMKYEILAMLKQGSGSIVNNASVGGLAGGAGVALYCASKHAVVGFTKSAALEYAQQGIRANAVCPGGIQTPFMDRLVGEPGANSEFRQQMNAAHPIGRLGTPEEVAAAVVYLCSDGASFITGQALAVDGGYLAR